MRRLENKTVNSVGYYAIDWVRFLRNRSPAGTTVDDVTYVSDPSGLGFSGLSISDSISNFTIDAGGQENTEYMIKATATLSNGEIEERSIPIKIVEHKT